MYADSPKRQGREGCPILAATTDRLWGQEVLESASADPQGAVKGFPPPTPPLKALDIPLHHNFKGHSSYSGGQPSSLTRSPASVPNGTRVMFNVSPEVPPYPP